jgi:hypothetical protein
MFSECSCRGLAPCVGPARSDRDGRMISQVYLRRQGSKRLSWGSKWVRIWQSKGWGPRACARAWSGLSQLGFGAGSKSAVGYLGHVEQVYLRQQGPNRLSWGCTGTRVRLWHFKAWASGPRAWARAWPGQLGCPG